MFSSKRNSKLDVMKVGLCFHNFTQMVSLLQVSVRCQSAGGGKVKSLQSAMVAGGGLRMYAGQAGPDSCNYPVYTLPPPPPLTPAPMSVLTSWTHTNTNML